MARYNVLYMNSHDTGRHIQPYGYAVPTPALQRLAEQGVMFRQAFCAGPTCSPSRAALLTGRYPHCTGMLGLAHRGFSLSHPDRHLAATLRRAGYATTLIGAHHEGKDPAALGYEQVVRSPVRDAPAVAEAAVRFLASAPREPFFLAVGTVETHRAFPDPGPEDDERYGRAPAPIPDNARTRRDMAGFCTLARRMDRAWGDVLGALDRAGLADRTIVLCTTDHGVSFPHMKCNLTDHGIGVLLLMRGPGGLAGGKVFDAMVSHVDVFPTLCELLALDPPDWLQGRSMMPLVRGETQEIRREVFAEVTYHAAYEPMRCIRTDRHKYVLRFHDRATPVLSNCDDGPTKSLWLEHGWRDRPVAREELYDLVFDPQERANLAAEPSRAGERDDLRRRLLEWMRQTDDPLLKGPVPLPQGAFANDMDDVSPHDPRPRPRG